MNICIVAGHTTTGKGTGAVGYINESTENRILAKKVTEYIKKAGHNCDYYEVNKSDTYLKDQTNFANKKVYDLVVQIHFNAGGGSGTETLYRSASGKKYANQVNKKLSTMYKNRGIKHDINDVGRKLYWITNTKYPAILIETCFVDSKVDTDKYVNNKDATAKLIAEGIIGKSIQDDPDKSTESNGDLWAVCVGAYKDKNKANAIVEELKKKGYTSTYLIIR
jgi:N-acetylmuramoyl-L-alanine amidase